EQWDALMKGVLAVSWQGRRNEDHIALRALLLEMQGPEAIAEGPLQQQLAFIRLSCDGRDFDAICANIAAMAQHPDPWLQRAARTFNAGSPGSARLSYTLLQRVRLLSLADVFREEYIVSLQCGAQGDLQEGIRALIIDKDKQPRWNPARLEDATEAWVQRFFEQPWPAGTEHPLADLGRH
nr:enoyl-CoA hydratase/isomerase family protein [Candidimonas sp.]